MVEDFEVETAIFLIREAKQRFKHVSYFYPKSLVKMKLKPFLRQCLPTMTRSKQVLTEDLKTFTFMAKNCLW